MDSQTISMIATGVGTTLGLALFAKFGATGNATPGDAKRAEVLFSVLEDGSGEWLGEGAIASAVQEKRKMTSGQIRMGLQALVARGDAEHADDPTWPEPRWRCAR